MGVDEIQSVKPNRAAIVLLLTVATPLSLTPVLLALGRPIWLLPLTLLACLTAIVHVRKFVTSATENPSPLEFVLGAVSVAGDMALVGLLWFLFHFLIYKVVHFFRPGSAQVVAFWVTLAVAAFLTVALNDGSDTAKYLYPNTAGVKSAFYPLVAEQRQMLRRGTLVLLLILAIGLAIFVFAYHIGFWFYFFLETYLFIVGVSATPTEERATRPRVDRDAIEKMAKVFEGDGYTVERFPRTRKPEVDPLLINLDLLAQRAEDLIMIEVKTQQESGEAVDWKAVSGLRTAAWALTDARGLPRSSMKTMLVLLDEKPDKMLRLAAERESTLLVGLTSAELSRLASSSAIEQRQAFVKQWTGKPAANYQINESRRRASHRGKRVPDA